MLDPSLACEVSIYGDDPLNPEYATQLRASADGESRIAFHGTFRRSELPRVINELDVLVVPSTWTENTPLVLFAAQAAGRPVIGSDVAGISEVITDGVNGRLFEVGNATALSAVIADIVRDPSLLLPMAERATPVEPP